MISKQFDNNKSVRKPSVKDSLLPSHGEVPFVYSHKQRLLEWTFKFVFTLKKFLKIDGTLELAKDYEFLKRLLKPLL